MGAIGILLLELMVVFACVASGTPTDLLSLIEPADYFASRRLELGARNLLELASGNPSDAKGEVRQLLATRWLGENKDRLGEHQEAVHQALARLARGPDGIAADYARIALARIDGKPLPVPPAAPKDGLREALEWFPKDVSLAVVLDARAPPAERPAGPDPELLRRFQGALALFLKMMPGEGREELYRIAEGVGNLRLDRLAIGMALDPEASGNGRYFVRGTGRMDHKRVAAYFREAFGRDSGFAEKKGLRGEIVTTFAPRDTPPALALIGDSDFLLAWYTNNSIGCAKLLEELLVVRDGGRPSLLAGPLGKTLRDISPRARGLVRGEVPREMIAAIARSPIGVAPEQMSLDLLSPGPAYADLDLRFRGTFANEADARQFARGLRTEVKQVGEALKDLSSPAQLAGIASLRKELERIEVESDGSVATVKVPVAAETLKVLLGLVEGVLSPPAGRTPNGG
jgi:hypothetical protein